MSNTKPALPEPFDYCYEWDGPYGTRKFSAASHNGMKPTRSVPIYRADQMHAHAAAIEAWARAVELERAEEWRKLYMRAINEANGLTNYVEDRQELTRAERKIEAIEAAARTLGAA